MQAHTSKRACASVYPSIEQQGILWFWPDLSQGAINMEAAAHPPPVFPELSDPSFKFDLTWRDMEYGLVVSLQKYIRFNRCNLKQKHLISFCSSFFKVDSFSYEERVCL